MLESLWNRLIAALDPPLPDNVLDSWVRPCRVASLDGDHLRIAAPNSFIREWLIEHHLPSLETAARAVLGGNPQVTIDLDPERARSGARPPLPRPPSPATGASGLSARHTFDSFVVGSSNQFAQAACQAVAELPSKSYNPLFIYGGVGLGKTHLLHAVGHQVTRLFPQMSVLYISSERFTNEVINAIRYDRMPELRAKFRNIDCLLIDDIQFISGKERTQEEFFHTFNDLYEARKQIVLTSDAPPKGIPDIEERLRSRFEWGLIADIQSPDFETRVAILRKKAEFERIVLPDDVAFLVASRIKANIREIEGSLTRMIAYCKLSNRELTIDLAHEVLSDLWLLDDAKIITIDLIQRKVAESFGVKVSDLRAQNRTKSVAFPRQIAMYLARQLTHASLAEVGRAFGGKDHTTVIHAVEKIQNLLHSDPRFKRTIDTLTQGITL